MNRNVIIHRRIVATLMSVAILAGIISSGCTDEPTSASNDVVNGIYKPDSKPFGKTYAEWSVAWAQWAFGQAVTDASGKVIHPLLDSTGANCHNGQSASSSVFFLGGFLGFQATVTRTCTIPSGKALFFPIITTYYDTTGGWTADSMQVYRNIYSTHYTDVSAEIDGRSAANPKNYAFLSELFNVTLPDRNLYQFQGKPIPAGIPAGTVMPYLLDGYWLMVAPLSKGTHTIHFLGKSSDGILQDITYNLTVQ